MLDSVDTLKNNILALKPVLTNLQGSTDFINVVANFMNKVQAGSTGSVGIFTYNNAVGIAALQLLPPTLTTSWIPLFANAIEAGVIAGTITPGTVVSPAWVSSGVDIATVPSPAVTIITLASAKALLITDLADVTSSNNPPEPLAKAISDYTKAFTFLCIGLGPPPAAAPIPLPFSAE